MITVMLMLINMMLMLMLMIMLRGRAGGGDEARFLGLWVRIVVDRALTDWYGASKEWLGW